MRGHKQSMSQPFVVLQQTIILLTLNLIYQRCFNFSECQFEDPLAVHVLIYFTLNTQKEELMYQTFGDAI